MADKKELGFAVSDRADTIDRIITLVEADRSVSSELMAEYRDVHYTTGNAFLESEYHYKKASLFLSENKISQALQEFEPVVAKYPFSFSVQEMWDRIMNSALEYFVALASNDPKNPEVETSFVELNRLGLHSSATFLVTLRHYIRTKKIEKARALAKNLLTVTPGLPSLNALCEELLQQGYDPEIAQRLFDTQSQLNLTIVKKDMNYESAHFLHAQYAKVSNLYSESRFDECLQLLQEILPKGDNFDLNYLEFYYREACCIDLMDNPMLAMIKFYRVTLAAPDWIMGQRSLRIAVHRANSKFLREMEQNVPHERVADAYRLISSLGHVSRKLAFKYLDGLIGDKRNHKRILSMLKAYCELYPFDEEVISTLFTFGFKLNNDDLVLMANKCQEEALSLRSWDLSLQCKLKVKMAA